MTSREAAHWALGGDEEVHGPPRDRHGAIQASGRVPGRLVGRRPGSPPRDHVAGEPHPRPRLPADYGVPVRVTDEPAVVRERIVRWFVGRRAELREISARAAKARDGSRQTVVIEGRPGIGKTSLLLRALEQLTGYRHLLADCARGSAIDQLIRDVDLACGVPSGPRPGGLLTTVRTIVEESGPVAIALDNAQRIDAESAAEMSLTLTALRTAAVLVIAAVQEPWRPDSSDEPQVRRFRRQLLAGRNASHIQLAELSVAETGQMLDRLGSAVSEHAVERLHRYTGGNPALLAVLLEEGLMTAHTAPADLLGFFDPLVTSILRAVSSLPLASRDLLAAMAVSEEPRPLAIVGSVARVEDPFEALEPLLDSGLVEWFPDETVAPVSIRYPMYRDVIYRSLPAVHRQTLHDLAAGFAVGTRSWAHRVAATRTAEPTLAAMLEHEANRYYQAGDSERAGTMLMWSAAVADPQERERHLTQAARWWLALRAIDWGPRLPACLSDLPPSASRSMVMGLLAEAAGRYGEAAALLAQASDLARTEGAARDLRPDIDLATALVQADLGGSDAQYQVAGELLGLEGLSGPQRAWAEYHAADACGRRDGPEAALRKLAELAPDAVIDAVSAVNTGAVNTGDGGDQNVRLWTRGIWRVRGGQLRAGNDDLERMLRAGDRTAVGSVAPMAHAYLAYVRYLLGDWKAAEQAVAQAIAHLSGHAVARLRIPVHAVAACVEAAAGRPDSAGRHVQLAQRWYAEVGPEDYAVFPAVAAATAAQARGDYRRMAVVLASLVAEPARNASHQWWWQPLEAEALIGTGQLGAAQRALDRLIDLVGPHRRHSATVTWLEAWLAAARHDELTARTLFEEIIARPLASEDVPLHRARLEHEYGRYLMSGRNRRAAIGQLRRAYELYRSLGARPYAERCASDLEACGVRASAAGEGQAGMEALAVLSPRERRVAHLAAQGLTNQEIAGELFISAKTVEYHLSNVFAKLGISSRRQLAARLGTQSQ